MSTSRDSQARTRRTPRNEVRASVLRAAARVFGEKGFAAATLEQVAAAAGLSKGAVYSNFGGKDELFLALLRDTVDERLRQIAAALHDGPATAGHVRGAGEAMTQTVQQRPELQMLFMEFWLRAARDPSVRDHFATHRYEIRALVTDLIREYQEDSGVELPMPAEQLAIGVVAMFNGFALECLIDSDGASPEMFGRLLDLLIHGRPAPGALR